LALYLLQADVIVNTTAFIVNATTFNVNCNFLARNPNPLGKSHMMEGLPISIWLKHSEGKWEDVPSGVRRKATGFTASLSSIRIWLQS